MPDITFEVEGVQYVIPRDQWIERIDGKCVIKFMHGPRKSEWILGINFFNLYYTVFDYENKQVGFAKSKDFGKESAKAFTKWFRMSSAKRHLLNLDGTTSPTDHKFTAIVVGLSLTFIAVVWMVCRTNRRKIKASVEESTESLSYKQKL
jgi:hypothetical protein